MPYQRLARVGGAVQDRVKRVIHTVMFSLPLPDKTTPTMTTSVKGSALQEVANATSTTNKTMAAASSTPDFPHVSLITFFGSGYGLMAIVMAILFNRIHHIVQRPRGPPPPVAPARGFRGAIRARVQRALTSPEAPFWLRLPGLFALLRAWTLFSIITLQLAGVWTAGAGDKVAQLSNTASLGWLINAPLVSYTLRYGARIVDRLGNWAGQMEMKDVSWSIFLCICVGLTFGALANGLDGVRRRDDGQGFSLFLSFFLHIYSSPITHMQRSSGSQETRPDIHGLFQLWLGLTELAWLQIMELSPRWRRNLLLPTGVCGMLGLGHFTYTLLSGSLRFPSFTFLTHLMALFLLTIILCTVAARAFTFLFTVGHIPSPMWKSLLPHEGAVPQPEDDVGIALLKIGVACIEATQFSGLRNELAPIEEAHPHVEITPDGSTIVGPERTGGFDNRIDNIQAAELRDPNAESRYAHHFNRFWLACGNLATDLFWHALLSHKLGRGTYRYLWRMYQARWWYGPRHWRVWRRAAWTAPPAPPPVEPPVLATWGTRAQPMPEIEVDADYDPQEYAQHVIHGEVIDEDDWATDDSGSGAETEDEDAGLLYRDLVKSDESEEGNSTLQPILLAHLTANTPGPLTRRRYNAMVRAGPSTASRAVTTATSLNSLQEAVLARREETTVIPQPNDWDEERQRSCVICMVQPRDVILWPCRCLLLCNGCRESLADRLAAKDHACPNCRTKVGGFSRIYIP